MKTNSHIKGQSEAQSLRFNQIKKGCKGGGYHHRSNNRNSGVGDGQTCNPRCGLGNIHYNRNNDNLLVIHPLI